MKQLAVIAAILACAAAHAHSASDAYLTLDLDARGRDTMVDGRWDIALRDLNFVLGLDDDGDGAITWGETRRHLARIEAYAYERLGASGAGVPCALDRGRTLVSARAGEGYAALSFRMVCRGAPRTLALDYRLFFDVDPTHRGIVIVRAGGGTSTALASPANARVTIGRP